MRILLVEDEDPTVEALKEGFQPFGVEIVEARSRIAR